MKTRTMVVLFILLTLVLSFAAFPFFRKPPESDYIERVGIIEATELHLSSKIAERIEALPYEEGDPVPVNAVAVRLDEREIAAQVAQAEANVQRGEAGLVNARAQIEKAKATLEDARRNIDRLSSLRQEGLVSDSDWDSARTRLELAGAELKAAEAEARSAAAELKQRQANLNLVEIRLKETEIHAPIGGVVTLKAFEAGEMVSPGATILTLIDPNSVWARVNLEEGEVGKVRIGARAEIFVGSLPNRVFEGKVSEVGAEGGFATQRDVTRGRQDIKTFRVKVRALSPEGLLKPGMTARVRIFVNEMEK
ncbi:HlyD family secretion protein [Candidatus Manganitrophus noduliformans]|uniref:HlyD family secretion protein n=1 Tax=Candidatus Manganitrophus noduliformans TaxID=2606439 RepID=A0A7X6DUL6_9BACT|nr:efflux RND transporter periplasmic adaptor subunit [Candidatus Manganitrophus noduliformans]NKE73707.1 HlyD family secretion protein [Candidatus Manganitrophus noduliformans]